MAADGLTKLASSQVMTKLRDYLDGKFPPIEKVTADVSLTDRTWIASTVRWWRTLRDRRTKAAPLVRLRPRSNKGGVLADGRLPEELQGLGLGRRTTFVHVPQIPARKKTSKGPSSAASAAAAKAKRSWAGYGGDYEENTDDEN